MTSSDLKNITNLTRIQLKEKIEKDQVFLGWRAKIQKTFEEFWPESLGTWRKYELMIAYRIQGWKIKNLWVYCEISWTKIAFQIINSGLSLN